METISKKEVLHLGHISMLSLSESNVPYVYDRLAKVLQYASHLKDLVKTHMAEQQLPKNINVFRQDIIVKTDPNPILSLAPDRQENYFAVPMILKND